MMNAALTNTTISRFDFTTKLYNKIDVKLPNPDLEIKIYHQGWEFAEETYQENAKSLLKVSLGMAIEIEIYDNFDEKVYTNNISLLKRLILKTKIKLCVQMLLMFVNFLKLY